MRFRKKLTQIPYQSQRITKVIKLKTSYLLWTAAGIAATLLVLLSLLPNIQGISIEAIDTNDIAFYLESQSSTISLDNIEELLSDEEISTLKFYRGKLLKKLKF